MNAIKNNLMAAAVVGTTLAIASSAVLAQSSVTVYGQVSQSLQKTTNKPTSLVQSTFGSNIGFKGTEDLGGGLSAYFEFRNNFDADTGMGHPTLWEEKSFVGLKGSFGSVQVGRFLNAYDDISFKAIGDSVAAQNGLGYSGRDDNSIGYYSPDFNGFSFAATTALKENSTNTKNVSSLNLVYANGPLKVAAAYENASGKPSIGHNSTLVGASYDFGVLSLLGDYAKASNGKDAKNLRLGVSAPIGAGALKVAYSKGKGVDAAYDNQFGVGYWYNLSKRTMLFTDANRTKDTAGTSINGFDVGINHVF